MYLGNMLILYLGKNILQVNFNQLQDIDLHKLLYIINQISQKPSGILKLFGIKVFIFFLSPITPTQTPISFQVS